MASLPPGLPPPPPIPLRERASILFVERGQLDVLDGAFVLVDQVHIPIGGLACLMLEPGTRVRHAAAALTACAATLLIRVGEAGSASIRPANPAGRVRTGFCSRPGSRWTTWLV